MKEISQETEKESTEKICSLEEYLWSLARFDAAVCEGCAVSQKTSGREVHPSLGYATYVFARILAHARTLLRSVPRSRWCTAEYEDWDFGSNAGNFRSILEATLLFHYLCDADPDEDNQRAIVQLMHLYDITKRAKIIHGGKVDNEYNETRAEIVERLQSTKRFNELPFDAQKIALKGKWLMLESKEEIIERIGWDSPKFFMLWNLTSQYAHVYSLAFYRIEANGRGTGMENNFDRQFLASGLDICAAALKEITDILCNHFSDAVDVRNGVHSIFSPGPFRNLPKAKRRAIRKNKTGRNRK